MLKHFTGTVISLLAIPPFAPSAFVTPVRVDLY